MNYPTYKEKKSVKKVPFYIIAPIVSVVFEIILIFVMLVALNALSFEGTNMLSVGPVILVGLAFCLVYALVEFIVRSFRDARWFEVPLGTMFIPAGIELILFIIMLTRWWSDRTNEHKEFAMYLFGTMCVYMVVASVYRCLGHLIYWLVDRNTPQYREKKMNKKNKKKSDK